MLAVIFGILLNPFLGTSSAGERGWYVCEALSAEFRTAEAPSSIVLSYDQGPVFQPLELGVKTSAGQAQYIKPRSAAGAPGAPAPFTFIPRTDYGTGNLAILLIDRLPHVGEPFTGTLVEAGLFRAAGVVKIACHQDRLR